MPHDPTRMPTKKSGGPREPEPSDQNDPHYRNCIQSCVGSCAKHTSSLTVTPAGIPILQMGRQRLRETLTDTAVVLHLEARGADAAEGAHEVLASAWQAGSHEAETLVGVWGEKGEGSRHQPVTGACLGREPAPTVTASWPRAQHKTSWIQGKG